MAYFARVFRLKSLILRRTLITSARLVLDKYRYLLFRYTLKKLSNDKHNPSVIFGASGISSTGWIATEQSWHDITSQKSWSTYFKPGKIRRMQAEHVLEHLDPIEVVRAIQNFYKFLEPGGYIRIAVPDGNHSSPEYIENVRPQGTGPGALDHKVLYTFSKLSKLFTDQGFVVNGLEYFNDSGDFIANHWKKKMASYIGQF